MNRVEEFRHSNEDDIKDNDEDDEDGNEEDDDDIDDTLPKWSFIRGSDPRIATCRGKLQNKRSKLNQEINKELRLRAGAENLFKATSNRKLRETVALELSFVNSNLQLLKEQLAELNSSVEVYQNEASAETALLPMIPLGLKETKEIDFREPFNDFILEHYSEDTGHYTEAVHDFMDLRQAMRTPLRNASGIALLFRYYNQLYFVERRFFSPDRTLGIYFEWFDSLTGVPSCQRTVAFEKACVLFNMGAVYTQVGAKQDRLSAKGLDAAVDNFLRAAGTFRYIHENFTNAPSMDLGPDMLEMLVQLMLGQARECLFEKLELQSRDRRNADVCFDLAQESAHLADVYAHVHDLIGREPVRDYVPYSWVSLVNVKREYYMGVAHRYSAHAHLADDNKQQGGNNNNSYAFRSRTPDDDGDDDGDHLDVNDVIGDDRHHKQKHERKLLARAHMRESIVRHEEAQRLMRMCRELKGKRALAAVLADAYQDVTEAYAASEQEDDFRELLDAPHIHTSTKFQLSLTSPDFAQYRVTDLFRGLGPIAIFSAKRHWSAPRLVQLHRGRFSSTTSNASSDGFGFSVRGDAPVIIAAVDPNSLADFGGVKEGDFIVSICDRDVKWSPHDQVVTLIKNAGDSLVMKLVTPMDRNYLRPTTAKSSSSNGGSTSTSASSKGSVSTTSSSGVSSGLPSPVGSIAQPHQNNNTNNNNKKLTWNPFKRNSTVVRDDKDFYENVILR